MLIDNDKKIPLAEWARPSSLDEVMGQDHILGKGSVLRTAIEKDELGSIILWGPPGTGKTTIASLIAQNTNSFFVSFSAVLAGVKDIREIVSQAKDRLNGNNKKTIVFVDEIHRFNKSQQDAFLPYVEDGTIVLIGATTENPSFEINSALLSRSRVFVLKSLEQKDIKQIVEGVLSNSNKFWKYDVILDKDAMSALIQSSHGDARTCLNILELAVTVSSKAEDNTRVITIKDIEKASQEKTLLYDKSGEEHYNIISALHKSIRGSDPQAALYWLYRMLKSGENPMFVARRLVRIASEDIGNADPQALGITVAAKEAYHFLGTPEGELALAQAAVYLATAPKSNAVYNAQKIVNEHIERFGSLPVPNNIRNAPTKLMKDIGYGKGYSYDHNEKNAYAGQNFLPKELEGNTYYKPKPWGFEREIQKRIDYWEKIKKEKNNK